MTAPLAASRVRAVILNYNRAALTLAAVQSILTQRYAPLDVVVVDNGSSEQEYEALTLGLAGCPAHLVRIGRNLGYSAGNNVGIRYTGLPDAAYIFIVNNDVTFPDPDTLGELVLSIEGGQPRCVAASPLVNTLTSGLPVREQIQVRRVPDYLMLLVSGSWWLRRLPGLRRRASAYVYADLRPYDQDTAVECETINGSCFLVTRPFLDEIGLLDEGTFLYQEEIILGKQMLMSGHTALLVTSIAVDHEQGATSGHHRSNARFSALQQMAVSDGYYCATYLGTPRLLVFALFVLRYFDAFAKLAFQALSPTRSR